MIDARMGSENRQVLAGSTPSWRSSTLPRYLIHDRDTISGARVDPALIGRGFVLRTHSASCRLSAFGSAIYPAAEIATRLSIDTRSSSTTGLDSRGYPRRASGILSSP